MERLGKFTEIEKEHIHDLLRSFDREGIVWKFPNDYGASLAVNSITHFVPEMAVLKFDENGSSELVYDTPITSDVISGVSKGDARQLLKQIKELKRR